MTERTLETQNGEAHWLVCGFGFFVTLAQWLCELEVENFFLHQRSVLH